VLAEKESEYLLPKLMEIIFNKEIAERRIG